MKKQNKIKKKRHEDVNSVGTKDSVNSSPIPKEIDTHYQLYKKHMWDIKFLEKCEICNSPFDEFGFCACGSGRS
ncbi:MAG TPA: hypothetical protein VF047_02735 [Nitrososphaeraceae archaeon]